ncbi:MAG: hypothetical protein WKF82_07195 [Nocardioidaceae bacterium]
MIEVARRWFDMFEGAGLDGVVAKPLAAPYQPGMRALIKIKHICVPPTLSSPVIASTNPRHSTSRSSGSLLLGLYDDTGRLQHVGVSAAFATTRRAELIAELAPLVIDPAAHPWSEWAAAREGDADRLPGAQSRWNAGKDLSWVPLDPSLVIEVGYDHLEGTRFRHTTQFRRWRP